MIAALIRKLASYGLSAEQIADVVEFVEADRHERHVTRHADRDGAMTDAERAKRYRARKRADSDRCDECDDRHVSRHVTRDAEPPLSLAKERSPPAPPSKENSTLTPPNPLSPSETSPKGEGEPVGFSEFWLSYPRKVGKLAAMRRFRDACKRIGGPDPPAVLLDALARVKPTWTEPRFIPHPATWLHQGRWEDEVETRKTWAELLAEDVA